MADDKLDDGRITEWLDSELSAPSGFAGGAKLNNLEWLRLECERVTAKGCRCEVREHKRRVGYFALFRV